MSASPPATSAPTTRLGGSSSPARDWSGVLRQVAGDRVDRAVFLVTAVLVGVGYSVMLPFAFTQRISTVNWRYLDARYVAFTVAFALAIAWLITLQIHAVRRVARAAASERQAGRGGPLGFLAAVVSVLPSLLCCSPILPTLVGLLGLSATTRLTTTVTLQHFFATKENLLLLGALVLLLGAGMWSLRKLANATCLTDECCATPVGDRDSARRGTLSINGHSSHPAAARVAPLAGGEKER